jgi:hypothetical protein
MTLCTDNTYVEDVRLIKPLFMAKRTRGIRIQYARNFTVCSALWNMVRILTTSLK